MNNTLGRLSNSLHFDSRVSGLTHNFYRYPARFSPQFVRQVINEFSAPGELILDPFMGGGTSIIEALAAGRCALGIDINSLAYFVTAAKTTPLSGNDGKSIQRWTASIYPLLDQTSFAAVEDGRLRNLPTQIRRLVRAAEAAFDVLPFPRQRRFVRCVLLRTLQWAVDCRIQIPSTHQILQRLNRDVSVMLAQLEEFCDRCTELGIQRNQITGWRTIRCRSAVGLDEDRSLKNFRTQARLVVTSPPYPGIHMLYHRWQVSGRRETPAPYWVAGLNDGFPESYYTFGSRQQKGNRQYFKFLRAAYRSVRRVLLPDARILQLVAFSNPDAQLPLFLEAMEQVGYKEVGMLSGSTNSELWRYVPNRKWYTSLNDEGGAAKEVLLCHRPVGSSR